MANFKEKLLKFARKKAKESNYSSKEYRAMLKMNKVLDLYLEIEALGYDSLCKFSGDDNYINARFSANAFLSSLLESITKGESAQHIETQVNQAITTIENMAANENK